MQYVRRCTAAVCKTINVIYSGSGTRLCHVIIQNCCVKKALEATYCVHIYTYL